MPFSAGKNQVGGILDPSQTTLSLNQRRTMERLVGQGIDRAVARQLAIALTKTALAKAEGHTPPQGVRAACRRGLELAGEYGGAGLTEGAKARARSMAAGEAQTDEQLARIRSFTARHGSYEKQTDPPSPGYVSWLLWGGDAGKSWANSKSERTNKSAIFIAKSALARVQVAKRSYHEAFSAACKEILPQGVVEKIHLRARSIAGGHAKAAARAAAQVDSTDVAKADWNEADHPRADNGEFGQGSGNAKSSERLKNERDRLFAAAREADDRGDFKAAREHRDAAAKASKEAIAAIRDERRASKGSEARGKKTPRQDSPDKQASGAGKPSQSTKPDESSRKAGESHQDAALRHAKEKLGHIEAAERAIKAGDKKEFDAAMAASKQSGRNVDKHEAAAERERKKETGALSSRLDSLIQIADQQSKEINRRNRALDRRPMAKAHAVLALVKGQKPMGAAFAHARASGKNQSHEARKRRANRYLKEQGHAPIGKDVKKTAPLPADVRAEQFLNLARQRRKKRQGAKDGVAKARQVDLRVPTTIIKAEETQWQKLLWSVVYEPDVFDSHGDRMDAATIQKAAHEAFRQGMYVNHEHVGPPIGAHIVESFTAPVDFTIDDAEGAHVIRKGTWVVGTQVTDDAVWDKVLRGEYGGVSLEGTAFARTLDEQVA